MAWERWKPGCFSDVPVMLACGEVAALTLACVPVMLACGEVAALGAGRVVDVQSHPLKRAQASCPDPPRDEEIKIQLKKTPREEGGKED